jgi:hypothetical protein
MLKKDLNIAKTLTAEYDRGLKEVSSDDEMKKLISGIRDNEIGHAEVFSKLLKPGNPVSREMYFRGLRCIKRYWYRSTDQRSQNAVSSMLRP